MKFYFTVAVLLFVDLVASSLFSQSFIIKYDSVACLNGASIRGISIVNDSVAWISGSKGTVARTLNGGRTWERIEGKGFGKRDFRSIQAFNKDSVYIANSGDSATIFCTHDGGKTWYDRFKIDNKGAFIDAISWWDIKNGITLSDPVSGWFMVFTFVNDQVQANSDEEMRAQEGEACFAASGTCLRTAPGGLAWFVTGGTNSRLFFSKDFGISWKSYPCPVLQGKNSQGAFSVIFTDVMNGIVVGGDYLQPAFTKNNCVITHDGGKSWIAPKVPPGGYRSCIENISPGVFIATGISGTDLSMDGGKTWKNFDRQSFNAVSKAKKGNLILIAGDKGKVGIVIKKQGK